MNYHPVFHRFDRWSGEIGSGWQVNFLGVRTRAEFTAQSAGALPAESCRVTTEYPPFDEEYFEWVDILEAVLAAERTFTMIELGAGWGRWLMNAAAAARQRGGLRTRLIGVEAEPTHFRWMQQHFRDNGVEAGSLTLIEAAVAAEDGVVRFHIGDPSSWYGQAIDPNQPAPRSARLLLGRLRSLVRRRRPRETRAIVDVRAISLSAILDHVEHVDLIDLDVQGVEAEVLESAPQKLSEKVARVHIGTHSRENESRLRTLFEQLGWEKLNDYPCGTETETPWGPIAFQDGVQTWRNPRVTRSSA